MSSCDVLSRIGAILLAGLSACNHSEPFGYVDYAPQGPRVPGPEARIAGAGAGSAWTENGGGILYISRCLERNPPSRPPTFNSNPAWAIPSVIMLPATGGSATWELCETDYTLRFPDDSMEVFTSAALGSDGRLLYVECVSLNLKNIDCINDGRATMWLSDSAWPFTRRHKLFDLYHVVLGTPPDPPDVLNMVSDLAWVGPSAFIARGLNLHPFYGITFLGLAYGTATVASPSLNLVPGTGEVRAYSAAEGGATLVFNRDSLAIERMPIHGGIAATIATLPRGAGHIVRDISCRGEFCLVLSREFVNGTAQSTFWTLHLDSGILAMLRSYPLLISGARLSPSSSAVLVTEPDGVHLFTELVQ